MRQTILRFGLIGILFALAGCETLHETARDVGRPVGGIARTPQAVMEGAADGYAGNSNMNPYGR